MGSIPYQARDEKDFCSVSFVFYFPTCMKSHSEHMRNPITGPVAFHLGLCHQKYFQVYNINEWDTPN